jgi:hypothetical protein
MELVVQGATRRWVGFGVMVTTYYNIMGELIVTSILEHTQTLTSIAVLRSHVRAVLGRDATMHPPSNHFSPSSSWSDLVRTWSVWPDSDSRWSGSGWHEGEIMIPLWLFVFHHSNSLRLGKVGGSRSKAILPHLNTYRVRISTAFATDKHPQPSTTATIRPSPRVELVN